MRSPMISSVIAAAALLAVAQAQNTQNITNLQPPNFNVSIGQPCNLQRNRLSLSSHQFRSACIATAYCDPVSSICKPKGCTTEQFPFGYRNDSLIPPTCPSGEFCPDEGDQCLPLLSVGQNCQMDRDDQCEPAPNSAQISTPMNHQGAICLKFTCYWQNQTAGNACVVDNNAYIGYRTNGSQFAEIVSRDNCAPGNYCNAQTNICESALELGASCSADKMCSSHNCGLGNTCLIAAGTVKAIPTWQYAVTGIGIIGLILGILVSLFLLHKRNRVQRQREIREYFHEQTTYRSSIIALHTAARERTSIYSASDSRLSLSQYDEHGHMVYRDDDSNRHLLNASSRRNSRLRESMTALDYVDDHEEEGEGDQSRGLLGSSRQQHYNQSRTSFVSDQDTPRQSFDYGQPSGSGGGGYKSVPMRQSVELPMGAGTPRKPGEHDPFTDPWEKK